MALDTILKRYFPALVLMLVATAAYFQARGAVQLVGMALAGGAHPSTVASSERDSRTAAAEPKSGQAILERNPFDSVTGPLPSQPLDIDSFPKRRTDASDPLSWPICEDVRALIVTESQDPWWSLTTLQEHGAPRPRLRRVGDDIAGKQVAFIGYNPRQMAPSVWLEGGGAVCQAMLFREQVPVVDPPATQIQKLSDTEFKVDRSLLEKTLEDQTSVIGAVRVAPERKDGQVIGLRLFGIRPDTPLSSLGLKNGDRLESINGFNISNPQKALEAYARLSTAKHLSVHLSRVGKPLEIDLNID
jgi:general secretion pathway protein C